MLFYFFYFYAIIEISFIKKRLMKGFKYMNYINGILEKYELNIDELLILIVSFTVFLPFYFLVFSIWKRSIPKRIKAPPK